MLVIAHRGANREATENSWDAFEKAIAAGATRLELDVQLSRDGHAVVMHDDQLGRTTACKGRISTMNADDLRALRLINGDSVPFLHEVVERLLPRIELNIEIKGTSTRLAAVVAEQVALHPLRDKVIVSCFHFEPLVWLKEHLPELQRACLWSSDTFSWPFFATLAPQVFLDKVGTTILHPHVGLVNENLMDQAASRGWQVYAWVPMAGEEDDREAMWTAMKTLGLHGLCTNYPRQLRAWLDDAAIDERLYSDGQVAKTESNQSF